MTIQDYISIAAITLTSLGGGGVIVFALSNWLGKVWANKLMLSEKQKHAKELEELRSDLKEKNDNNLESLKHELEITKEKYLKDHIDKVAIYRSAIDLIATTVAKVEMIMLQKREPLSVEELHDFEIHRLRIYAYLAMHAPQSVMTANDNLTDLIISVIYDGEQITWEHFRGLAIALLNEIRKDLGVNPDPITYQGKR